MQTESNVLADAAAEAFDGRLCVSTWLGYGNVLFLGFGDTTYQGPFGRGGRPAPPYELETGMARWRLTGQACADSDGEAGDAEKAAFLLVGHRVHSWRLAARNSLHIEFEGDFAIEVTPVTDAKLGDTDAWSITMPGGRVIAVSCDGRIADVDVRLPIRDWFSSPR